MSLQETVLQAARAWLKATSASAALADGKVIPANDKGTRPEMPYLTVQVIAARSLGPAEQIDTVATSGDPQRSARETKEYTVQVTGYGEDSRDYLERARLHLDLPASLAVQTSSKVTITQPGEVRDLTTLRDSSFEERYILEVIAAIVATSDPEARVEPVSVEIETEADEPEGTDPLEDTFTFIV